MKASSVEPVPAAIVLHVKVACGFLARARGLLGMPAVAPGCGLLLPGVNAVHGFGMHRVIDVVFLDDRATVVRCQPLAPWRIARCAAASAVLEMRAGEANRLQLRAGSRLSLRPIADIFRRPAPAACAQPSGRETEAQPPASRAFTNRRASRRFGGMQALHWMLASAAASFSQDTTAADAGTSERPASGATPAPVRVPASRTATLRRFEAEAEALYRDSTPRTADAELVRLYEVLATSAPRRRAHAWLRIGNIHQRSGAVGAAMEAYRKALDEAAADEQSAGAEESRRKALLNLASLALEQARQALAGLPPTLPAAVEKVEHLEALSQLLERSSPPPPPQRHLPPQQHLQPQRHLPPQRHPPSQRRPQTEPAPAAVAPGDISREHTHVVERYTASARRNAVKAARGSLQSDPDSELLARPLPRPKTRARERLPDVEYLLGDPQQSQATSRDPAPKGAKK